MKSSDFHMKWDQSPFPDTSYSTVSIQIGKQSWCPARSKAEVSVEAPTARCCCQIFSRRLVSACWHTLDGVFAPWDLVTNHCRKVLGEEVPLLGLTTSGTMSDSSTLSPPALLCSVPFWPFANTCQSGRRVGMHIPSVPSNWSERHWLIWPLDLVSSWCICPVDCSVRWQRGLSRMGPDTHKSCGMIPLSVSILLMSTSLDSQSAVRLLSPGRWYLDRVTPCADTSPTSRR